MRRFAISVLVFAGGCVQVTVPPSDADAGNRGTPNQSPLTPGIYFGTETCEFEVRGNGQTVSETVVSERTLIISESGIPIRNGEEEFEGRTDADNFDGVNFSMTVEDVSTMADGVTVLALGGATHPDVRINVRELDVYTPVNDGQILLTSEIFVGLSGGLNGSSTGVCRAVYSR